MKALMKRLLPESALAWLRGCESDMKLRRETLHQMKRFRRNYARRGSTRKSHLETRIVFFTHQIEKGLSHTDFRYGFGKKVLAQMAPLMETLRTTDRTSHITRSIEPLYPHCTNIVCGMRPSNSI